MIIMKPWYIPPVFTFQARMLKVERLLRATMPRCTAVQVQVGALHLSFALALPGVVAVYPETRAWASRRQAPCWSAIRVPRVSSWSCPRSVFVYFGFPCARVRGPRDGGRLGLALALFLFSLAPLVHVRGVGVGLERTGARCESSCAWLFLTLLSLFFFFVSKALLVRVGVGLEFCTCAALAWASRRRAPCWVCEPS